MTTQRQQSSNVPPSVRAAIANNFDGDAQLYQAFAASCAVQFAHDLSAGQADCDAGDLPALRRLAHNLKSALTMLGHDELFAVAQTLERQAAAGDLPSARASWRVLRAQLSLWQPP
jgi:HPt (histidine-containing phosphotransfer) domain-containing protein